MGFEQADKFRAKWEGGLTDNSSDPGGITKYGVSLRWLKSVGHDVDNDGDVDADDIRALTPDQAGELFKDRFWDAYKLDDFPDATGMALYDAMVNTGPVQAVKFLQRAGNFYPGIVLRDDGVVGQKTRDAVASIATDLASDVALAMRCIKERKAFYVRLSQQKPSLSVFLKGWLNRSAALESSIQAGGA